MTQVIPGYTHEVKTAISISDATFQRAEHAAHQLGISRSEFFTRAAALYLAQLDAQQLGNRIDEVLERIGPDAGDAGIGLLRLQQLTEGDEW